MPAESAAPSSRRSPEEILRAAGVAFTVHEHGPDGTPPPASGTALKTLAVETGGELVLAALRAGDGVHPGKLAKALGVGRTTLNAVTPAALQVELGFEPGWVSLLTDFPAARLVDEAVPALGTVHVAAGRPGVTIELAAADLIAAAGATVAELVAPPLTGAGKTADA